MVVSSLRRLVPFLALVLLSLRTAQPVLFVDADATGRGDGSSWADAYTDLQAALETAEPQTEIWVANGTYRATQGIDRTATFRLGDGVAVYGGFAGTETTREQRDWETHETILSGEAGQPDDPADNVFHVVTTDSVTAATVLDGFTITGAYADGIFPDNRGGGLRNVTGHPTIRNCLFTLNTVRSRNERAGFGAGMFSDGGSPTLTNVRFVANRAEGESGGGGMANKNGARPLLRHVVFERNVAGTLGGGMTNDTGSSPVLVDVAFRENTAQYTGGMDNYQNASPVLWNVVFEGNVADEYGGGMTNDTGSDARLYNVVFVANASHNATKEGGGGLHNHDSSPTLVNVTFVANRAARGAGSMHTVGEGRPVVRNAIFWDDVQEIEGKVDLRHAVIQGGFTYPADVVEDDPLFVHPPGADGYGDLHLRPGSPALDAGDATSLPPDTADLDGDGDTDEPLPVDLDGAPRVAGEKVDLGAFEGTQRN